MCEMKGPLFRSVPLDKLTACSKRDFHIKQKYRNFKKFNEVTTFYKTSIMLNLTTCSKYMIQMKFLTEIYYKIIWQTFKNKNYASNDRAKSEQNDQQARWQGNRLISISPTLSNFIEKHVATFIQNFTM